jgi:hypothetical protein
MKKPYLKPQRLVASFLLCALAACATQLSAQTHQLQGHVRNAHGGWLNQGRVYIQGGDQCQITSSGEYALNLDIGNRYDPGGELILWISHPTLGLCSQTITIPKSLLQELLFEPNRLGLTGTVRDPEGPYIEGLEVRLQFENNPNAEPTVLQTKTDEFGCFHFIIDRTQYGDVQDVRVYVLDRKYNCYMPWDDKRSINAHVPITMIRKVGCVNPPLTITETPKGITPLQNNMGVICILNQTPYRMSVCLQSGCNIIWANVPQLDLEPGQQDCFDGLEPGKYSIRRYLARYQDKETGQWGFHELDDGICEEINVVAGERRILKYRN